MLNFEGLPKIVLFNSRRLILWKRVFDRVNFKTKQKQISLHRHFKYRMSKHIWDLKDSNTSYEIKWRIIRELAYKGNPFCCKVKISEQVTKCHFGNKFSPASNHKPGRLSDLGGVNN